MERFRVCDARPSPLNYQIDLLLAIKVWRWLQEGTREERDCSNCHLGKPRVQLHLRKEGKKKNPVIMKSPRHCVPCHNPRHKQTMSSHERKLHFVDEGRPSRCARKFVFRCNEKFNPTGAELEIINVHFCSASPASSMPITPSSFRSLHGAQYNYICDSPKY